MFAAGLAIGWTRSAGAVVPRGRASELRDATDRSVASPREAAWQAAGPDARMVRAADRLADGLGRTWIAWDGVRAMPARILLEGVAAPGAITSAARAAAHAQALLARHIDELAPGSSVGDFVLVGNDLSDVAGAPLRTVGFIQQFSGREVIGGQISFRFKADRLIAIVSDALPNVAVPHRARTVAAKDATVQAQAWVARDFSAGRHVAGPPGPVVILPLWHASGIEYREVVRVDVEAHSPRDRFAVYVDAENGTPVARRSTLAFATAGIVYNVPIRRPVSSRTEFAAPLVGVSVDGISLVTANDGTFEFTTTPGTAINSASGPLVAVENAAGEVASSQFQVIPGNAFVWDARTDEFVDAQLAAFIHAGLAKQYVSAIAPDLPWLSNQLQVTVNIDDDCNAFSDGDTINFFRASSDCENTGRIADVVYHEFAHSVHVQSVIPGVGFFDTGLSEGIADYLAATMIDDSGVGRGLFLDDSPLRELDPPGLEYRWPDGKGEVHKEGLIIGGALWDLREQLILKHGRAVGVGLSDHIWYESIRRAVDIPSMYLEALVVDDDDGNLANGTPNVCEINAAYGPHGLIQLEIGAERVAATGIGQGVRVELQLALPSWPDCPIAATPVLYWRPRGGVDTSVPMVASAGSWVADVPAQPAGTLIEYRVEVDYGTGATRALPDNPVDPWYQFYVGPVVPLYCTGFADGGPDWARSGDMSVGQPRGTQGNRDPASAGDADGVVLGTELQEHGLYTANVPSSATSPVISTVGYTGIRLQYQRWLTVEDGYFDRAAIEADGVEVWRNFASDDEDLATFAHVDRQWRFHDVELGEAAADGAVQVAFTLSPDGGLEFGGWNVDALCVVAANASTGCGNGVLEATEGCDDGNVLDGDGCSAACDREGESSGSGEDSSAESSGGDDDGAADSELVDRGCVCRYRSDRAPWGGSALAALIALLRRRRRANPRQRPARSRNS